MLFVNKKGSTPQDLYRARKQREEEERLAYLPPGLINHGNTCFMNSVLQGLIASPLLSDIVRFTLSESHLPLLSTRSPQLTNGHGRGGKWEKPWEQSMPLGDMFIELLEKAWTIQDNRQRVSLSPKDILAKLGSKYDQYLDFRQQDAHELLRHLLDAMRMEEVDIIKKRQPLGPKKKRRRVQKVDTDQSGTESVWKEISDQSADSIPEVERLTPFVDMIFGGQLASILVCERCKKVSCTYEDFNDLSLSIRREDVAKVRKRDKLRNFAKRLNRRSETADIKPRSLPTSPVRKTIDLDVLQQPSVSAVRRLSLDQDNAQGEVSEDNEVNISIQEVKEKVQTSEVNMDKAKEQAADDDLHIDQDKPVVNQEHIVWKDVKNREAEKPKDKDSDAWTRLGRRLSRSVKPKKNRDLSTSEVKDDLKQKEKGTERDKEKEKMWKRKSATDFKTLGFWTDPIDLTSPITSFSRDEISLSSTPKSIASHKSSPTPSRAASAVHMPSPLVTSSPLLSAIPENKYSNKPSLRGRQPSPARPKSPYRPKLSREDTAYLRRILGDIPTASNPFTVFRPPGAAVDSAAVSVSLWDKLGNVLTIEDCLRMFTAVEALDGENKVGCRRCYKIEHGLYEQRGRPSEKGNVCTLIDDDSSSSESSSDEHEDEQVKSASAQVPPISRQNAVSSLETSSTAPSIHVSVTDLNGHNAEAHNINVVHEISLDIDDKDNSKTSLTHGGLPIISISNTAPDSPISAGSRPATSLQAAFETSLNGDLEDLEEPLTARPDAPIPISHSRDSLKLPATKSQRRTNDRPNGFGDSSSLSSDESGDDLESDASMANSLLSEGSSIAPSQTVSRPLTPAEKPKRLKNTAGIPRSKQVVFQPSYKRYLIAKPPPVLVIHLKRFQQVSKTTMPFFSNFKKLDDFVRFPEYLDLQPFLLPRKDTGKKALRRVSDSNFSKGGEKCMYRLFAVVVHIGNMLGGHYVAYTALPAKTTDPSEVPVETLDGSLRPPLQLSNNRTASFENISQAKSKSTISQRQWCYISDTIVRLTTLDEVLKAKAYICMYERVQY